MGYSSTSLQARNRKKMSGGADYPQSRRKPIDIDLNDTEFVDALCGTLVPLLVGRNSAIAPRVIKPQPVDRTHDALHACRVEEFVQLLLDEDDNSCEDFAFREAASGADPQRMAADYLGPAARLLGDYWRMDVCDFMQVTVCMSRIQRLFWRLVDECPPSAECRVGHAILFSPVPGEQHSFGQSVVEDAFRRDGWQVDCCGFDEEEQMLRLARENEYQIVALSISAETFLPVMAATILRIRRRSRNAAVSIMAGGSLVIDQPSAIRTAGADLLALDVAHSLALAEAAVAAS